MAISGGQAREKLYREKKRSRDPSFRKKKPLEYFPIARKTDLGFAGQGLAIGFGDAGAVMSRLNNRLYRYGKLYDIKLDLSAAATPGVVFEVWALSNTWYVQKAFEEAKAAYDKSYEDEKEFVNQSNIARWRDFRIAFADVVSYNNVISDWAYPRSAASPQTLTAANIVAGDIVDSIVEDNAGVTKAFSWSPVSSGSYYSCIAEYDLAGNQTRTPNLGTGDMPFEGLQADSSTVEAAALQTRGQDPPYGATAFNGIWVKVGELTVGTAGQTRLSTGYFHAPCGVFAVKAVGGTGDIGADAADNISLEVKSGKYKGVSAHNMERM